MYEFDIKHVPGKWHLAPDACSRYPVSALSALITVLQQHATTAEICSSLDMESCVNSSVLAAMSGGGFTTGIDTGVITWNRVKEASALDDEIQLLINNILSGFPDTKHELPEATQPYWNVRDELSCHDGVALYQSRIVVPHALRAEVLDSLHSAHQGIVGMKARARASVYWPGLSAAISSRRAQCHTCNRISPSQAAEPMVISEAPEYPFDKVVADYFFLAGIKYLVYADRYTGWVVIMKSDPLDTDTNALKKSLRTLFGIYGAPREIATDGGPPFTSHAIANFLNTWGVHHRVSSAYYAQSNGRAELAVKSGKRILLDNVGPHGSIDTDKVARALLQYRNTPIQDIGLSPAQLLYGRTLRDWIPSVKDAHKIRHEWLVVAEDRERALAKRNILQMEKYNEHTRPLPPLSVGDHVAVQNQTGSHANKWEKSGKIVECGDYRQYVVRMDGSGRCTTRNRRFLRKIQPVCADQPRHNIRPAEAALRHEAHFQQPPLVGHNPVRPAFELTNPPVSSAPQGHAHLDIPELVQCEIDAPTVQDTAPDPVNTPPQVQTPPAIMTGPRRSTRLKKPRRELSPQFRGKSHGYSQLIQPPAGLPDPPGGLEGGGEM